MGWSCVSGGSGVEGDAELGVRGVWCHQTEHRESVAGDKNLFVKAVQKGIYQQ